MREKSLIAMIIDMVRLDEFRNESEVLDIAKGKYELPTNWKSMGNSIRRNRNKK